MPDTPRARPATLKRFLPIVALTLALVVLFLYMTGVLGPAPLDLIRWVESRGMFTFFAAMTLLPLAGVPITLFYLAAGVVFDPPVNIAGTAAALALNHLLAYALARRTLKPGLDVLLRKSGFRLPKPGRRNPLYTALFLKLTPGPPFILRSYMMAMAGIPLKTYLLVSWPLSMAYALPAILLGESAMEGRTGLGMLALGILLVLALLTQFLRKRYLERRAAVDGDPEKVPDSDGVHL